MPHRILHAFLVVAAALVFSGGTLCSIQAQEPTTAEPAAAEPTTAEPNSAAEPADTEQPASAPADAEPAPAPEPAPTPEPTPAPVAPAVQAAPAPRVQAGGSQSLRFNFSNTSWKDVLLWLSEEADLSLKAERYPEGTLSFVDPSREYTVSEALDQLNRQLLDRGFAMVRRGRMLMVIDLESPLAPKYIENIAEVVTPDALDGRGESDIVKTIFPLGAMTPEAADRELRQMLGPSMPMSILASARQVVITDTVARLKAIRSVLEEATNAGLEVTEIVLKHRAADEVLMLARPLLGLEEGVNSNDSIKIAIDPFGDRMFVAGEPSSVALFQRIVEKADKPLMLDGEQTKEVQLPELRTYPITLADPSTVFDVLSTLLAGLPDTRLSLDPASNSLIVFTRPDTHTIVQSALDKLEGKGIQVDTIQLRRLEPSAALLTINKFFGKTEENSLGPIVDGDPITGRLWIRGTAEQISQTKDLIERLEGSDALGSLGDTIRVLPYSGQNAVDLLEQAELMWENSGRKNRIRMITPAAKQNDGGFPERRLQRDGEQPGDGPSAPADNAAADDPPQTARRAIARSPFRLAVQRTAVTQAAPASAPDTAAEPTAAAPQAAPTDADEPKSSANADPRSGADIVITFTPQGMIVASDDPLALDDFEDLLRTLSEQSSFSNQQPTVFWLKYVKAGVASSMVTEILGGDSSGGMGATGGGLLDELGGGLGMLGGLMGLGGGGGMGDSGGGPILTATGSVSIVPDDRLNALIVQANAMDMQTIETILQVIDREESPEDVQTIAKPRLIPVIYNRASDVAEIVKGVFAERMASAAGSGGGGNNQPKPEDIIKALRGGGGGGGGREQGEKSEPTKVSIAVDARSNSLIVTATPQDFDEIRELVEQVDQAGAESEEITDVIALNGAVNPEVIKQALESVLGKSVDASKTTSTTATATTTTNRTDNNGSSAADIQRRIEAFRAMQGAMGGGGRTGRGGGAPGGGGGPGGGGRTGGGRGGR